MEWLFACFALSTFPKQIRKPAWWGTYGWGKAWQCTEAMAVWAPKGTCHVSPGHPITCLKTRWLWQGTRRHCTHVWLKLPGPASENQNASGWEWQSLWEILIANWSFQWFLPTPNCQQMISQKTGEAFAATFTAYHSLHQTPPWMCWGGRWRSHGEWHWWHFFRSLSPAKVFCGRSQRSWTYTNVSKWKLIRCSTSSHSTGFLHSPWFYVACWPLPDHFHRHPDHKRSQRIALLLQLLPLTPHWHLQLPSKKTRNSSLHHQVTAHIITRFLINETSLCTILLQKSMINYLMDPATSTSATFEINDSNSVPPRLIRLHTGVDLYLKRHIQLQIAMAPATVTLEELINFWGFSLWIYKSYKSHVESCRNTFTIAV